MTLTLKHARGHFVNDSSVHMLPNKAKVCLYYSSINIQQLSYLADIISPLIFLAPPLKLLCI